MLALQEKSPITNRRTITTRSAGIALATVVACALATGTASAATSSAPVRQEILVMTTGLDPAHQVAIPAFSCPAETPYLVNIVFDSNRNVYKGVKVEESGGSSGGMGVTIGSRATKVGSTNYISGWQADDTWAQATNWGPRYNNFSVYAFCTSSTTEAYLG